VSYSQFLGKVHLVSIRHFWAYYTKRGHIEYCSIEVNFLNNFNESDAHFALSSTISKMTQKLCKFSQFPVRGIFKKLHFGK